MRTLIAALALVGAVRMEEPEFDTQLIEFEEPTDDAVLAELENSDNDNDELAEDDDSDLAELDFNELTAEDLAELDEDADEDKSISKRVASYIRMAYNIYKKKGAKAAKRRLYMLYKLVKKWAPKKARAMKAAYMRIKAAIKKFGHKKVMKAIKKHIAAKRAARKK